MNTINSLNEIISFDEGFKSSINLYLNLNNKDKILGYIPTKSSVSFLLEYLSAVKGNKEQASIIIGPYGKGKSHLLLVLLAIVSMERTDVNKKIVQQLKNQISQVDEIGKEAAEYIDFIWNKMGRFLPVLINNMQNDLGQALLYAINDALKREKIEGIIPDTYYSLAIQKIQNWEKEYPDTYALLEKKISENNGSIVELKAGLAAFSKKELELFIELYAQLTSGGEFNPMAASDPLALYKDVSEKLVEDYKFSGLYIVFDEFSKYIESQDRKNNGSNMKLLQDMCELANDSRSTKVHITMVAHKSIKEYGKFLSAETINAFTGIEGRLVERLFVTSSKNNYELIKNAIIKNPDVFDGVPNFDGYSEKDKLDEFYNIPAFKSKFNKNDFQRIVFRGCYPLNPISSYLLLNISEKVAQNERTLFTFISNDEPHSLARFVKNHTKEMSWTAGADLVYNYFSGLFKKEVINEHVHNEWLNAEYALSKCGNKDQEKIVKALATFLIVNKEEEMPTEEQYLALATGISNVTEIVDELISKQIVYRKGSTNNLVFKTRAGSALRTEIKRQRSLRGDKINYGKVFEEVSKKYYVIPRKYNANHMMTRYFRYEYISVQNFLELENTEVLFDDLFSDGKVIALFSISKIDISTVQKHLKKLACERLVVVCPKESINISKASLDFEILQDLKNNNFFTTDNEIMKREIPVLEEELSKEIGAHLEAIYEEDDTCKAFYMSDSALYSGSPTGIENIVNECCERIYHKSPKINNELINRREILTGQTKKARINIIQAVLDHEDNENFYSGTNQEATIYRSLFKQTGIIEGKSQKELQEILSVMTLFLESCSDQKRSLNELINTLESAPYGMRKGVIPLYLGYLLANRNEDIIVYFADMEIQISADIVVNMCEHSNDYELFISKADLQKEKYIESLNLLFGVRDNRNLSVNRIKNIIICMQRWFRALPQVTRNTIDFSKYEIDENIKLFLPKVRKLLQQVDPNPYEILFSKLPEIFGTKESFEGTYALIDTCKTAFDDFFDWIVKMAVIGTKNVFGARKNQDLYHIVKEWYENQSELSKSGLHGGRITNLMSCIEKLNVYDDTEVTKKVIKAVSDVYVENWNDASYIKYIDELCTVKIEIVNLKDQKFENKKKLSFVGKNGNEIEKHYELTTESTGTVLRNIIEDALEEYSDLSINDRVAILLEMIEKVIG